MDKKVYITCKGCGLKRNCAPSTKDGELICDECQFFEDVANSKGMYDG